MVGWERKEWTEGRSLDPTWIAGKGTAASGWGCPPAA